MIRHLLGMKSSLLTLSRCMLAILLPVSGALAADSPVLNVFLVQNSGWMEPFYVDGNSKFKPLVKTVIEKVSRKGDEIVIASFNQSLGENRSPLLAWGQGQGPGSGLALPHFGELPRRML